jgi:hypothetical protein
VRLKLSNELPPLAPNVFEEPTEKLDADILVHFLMQLAIHDLALSRLPAFVMLATVYFLHLWLVLSKVQALRWMNFTANCQLEVFVGDLSILVQIEPVKEVFELLIVKIEAPVLEVKPQFFRQY